MYLRTIQRRNKDGSVTRYVQLAHDHRKGRSTQAEVLVQLGREERLDMDGLRRLVGSITRYLDGAGASSHGRCRARPSLGGGVLLHARRGVAAGRAVAAAGCRRGAARGARRAQVHHRCGAGAVRAGL
jgi:hypothetical protein